MWKTLSEGAPSPNDDILINVEAFRGAVRKGDWKLIKIALLPGQDENYTTSPTTPAKPPISPAKTPRSSAISNAVAPNTPGSRRRASGSRRNPAFVGAQARPSWTRTSISTTMACLTRRLRDRYQVARDARTSIAGTSLPCRSHRNARQGLRTRIATKPTHHKTLPVIRAVFVVFIRLLLKLTKDSEYEYRFHQCGNLSQFPARPTIDRRQVAIGHQMDAVSSQPWTARMR